MNIEVFNHIPQPPDNLKIKKFADLAEQADNSFTALAYALESEKVKIDKLREFADHIPDFCETKARELQNLVLTMPKGSQGNIALSAKMLEREASAQKLEMLEKELEKVSLPEEIVKLLHYGKQMAESMYTYPEDALKSDASAGFKLGDIMEKCEIGVNEYQKAVSTVIEFFKNRAGSFYGMVKVADALHGSYKTAISNWKEKKANLTESEKEGIRLLQIFISNFEYALSKFFHIEHISLSEGQNADYDIVQPIGVEETANKSLNETISSIVREGYRFSRELSKNPKDGDILLQPQVFVYQYKK